MIMDFEIRDFGIDIQVARDKLAGFQSSDELAQFLKDEGIQGYVGMAYNCPIAIWMQGMTNKNVAVSIEYMWDKNDSYSKQIDHNEVLQGFIFDFDHGYHSDLIRRP